MLCCLKFLYGGTTSNANVAMKINQNNIQLDTSNMGSVWKFNGKPNELIYVLILSEKIDYITACVLILLINQQVMKWLF